MPKFGRRIQDLRIDSGKTLREVAEVLDVKISYLSDIEHGRKKPFAPELLNKFVKFIGCDGNELQYLAVRERDSIEIPLSRGSNKINELAFALARSIDSGSISDATAVELLSYLNLKKEN